MSLKSFHIFFIFFAALFCGAFGAWTMFDQSPLADQLRVVGYGAFVCAAGLIIYGFWFAFRKCKSLNAF